MFDYRTIDLESHAELCLSFRRDAYMCSFGTLAGFEIFAADYIERVGKRVALDNWFYEHVWHNNTIVGQLEYRSDSDWQNFGYINLIYLSAPYRNKGLAEGLQQRIQTVLSNCSCRGAVLSVSRSNKAALKHYAKVGYLYIRDNPKRVGTEFWKIEYPRK